MWLGLITIACIIIGIFGKPILPEKWGEKGKTLLASITLENIPGILLTGLVSLIIFSLAVFIIKGRATICYRIYIYIFSSSGCNPHREL